MSHENEHDRLDPGEQRQIERRLAALAPAPAQLNRDRLMFLAGQASGGRESPDADAFPKVDACDASEVIRKQTLPARGRSSGRHGLWPAATMTLGATSLALLVALIARPQPQVVYRDREVLVVQPHKLAEQQRTPVAEASAVPITLAAVQRSGATSVPTDNYVRTRDVALRMGLDAIGGPRLSGFAGGDDGTFATYGNWLQSLTDSADGGGNKSSLSPLPNM